MNIDASLFTFLNSFAGNSRLGDSLILFVGDKFPAILFVLFLIFVWKFTKEKKKVIFTTIVSTIISRGVITELIRHFLHRPRPFSVMNISQIIYDKSWSFPSGHETFLFALAFSVYFYNKKWGIFFIISSILVGIGRIMGGVHYPSDILGGIIIGIASAYLAKFLLNKFSGQLKLK